MTPTRCINVQDVIDRHPVSRLQGLVIALCFLVVAIDGFDTAAVGLIAPALRLEWGVTYLGQPPTEETMWRRQAPCRTR